MLILKLLGPSYHFCKDSCGELVNTVYFVWVNKISMARNPDAGHRCIAQTELIQACIEIKKSIVEADFKEARVKKTAPTGFLLGHAIETAAALSLDTVSCVTAGKSRKSLLKLGLLFCKDAESIAERRSLIGFCFIYCGRALQRYMTRKSTRVLLMWHLSMALVTYVLSVSHLQNLNSF